MALTKISTDGFKDDAVTTDKLANAINTERTANTAKVSTTINNNADNRIITGSGTANTLEGEANLTFDGDTAAITRSGNSAGGLSITNTNNTQASAHARLELSGGDNASAIMRMECNGHANEFIADGSGNLRVDDNGVERLRIDSSGDIGLGTSTPNLTGYTSPVTSIGKSGNPYAVLELQGTQTSDGAMGLITGYNTSGSSRIATINWNRDGANNSGSLSFETASSGTLGERFRIRSTGGVTFNGDTADANALDDYEEGTFSPSVASGGSVSSYTHQYGYYIKIGRMVHWQIYMAINGSGGSTGFTLGNFPFTSGAYNSTAYGGATVGYANNTFQTDNMYLYQEQNSTTLIFRDRAGQAIAGNSGAIFGNADFILFGQYITA